jgi:hypothetical protein
MTLWKQGASAVPVLVRLRIIFGSAGIGIGGVLPIGTALVTEFAPTMIVMGVVGVALGGRLGRPRCRAIHVDLWLARARPTRPRRRCPEQTEPLAPRHVARQQTGPVCATGSTNDPKPEREQRTPPVSKESSPCFLSVIAFGEII